MNTRELAPENRIIVEKLLATVLFSFFAKSRYCVRLIPLLDSNQSQMDPVRQVNGRPRGRSPTCSSRKGSYNHDQARSGAQRVCRPISTAGILPEGKATGM
jgi:hypothetical protein